MILKRLAALAAIAGLGLSVGCSNSRMTCSNGCGTTSSSFFSRLTGRSRTVEAVPVEADSAPSCCEGNMPSCCEGPILMDRGPTFGPSTPGFPASPGVPVFPGSPPLAPTPRLVPEPQAQARPYNP